MGRHDDERPAVDAPAPAAPAATVAVHDDRHWAADLRSALGGSAAFLGALLLLDRGFGALTAPRAVLWVALGVLLFLVLCPPRVSAGEGWVAVRGPLRVRRVRTDRLLLVRCPEGVAQRLVLRDRLGGRVEIDVRVLTSNPPLWHRLHEDARTCAGRGPLVRGQGDLRRLAERIDRETALSVFRESGLA